MSGRIIRISHQHHNSQQGVPKGLKLVAGETPFLSFKQVAS